MAKSFKAEIPFCKREIGTRNDTTDCPRLFIHTIKNTTFRGTVTQ